jgi:hypothetical protein
VFCSTTSRKVYRLDCSGDTFVDSLRGYAAAIITNPTGIKAYLGALDSILVYNLATGAHLAGYSGMADGGFWNDRWNRVQFESDVSARITSVDGDSDSLICWLRVGPTAMGNELALTYDENSDRLFCSNRTACSVYVATGAGDSLITTLPTGLAPVHALWCERTDAVYVANRRGSSLTVIRDSSVALNERPETPVRQAPVQPTLVASRVLEVPRGSSVYTAEGRRVSPAMPSGRSPARLAKGVYFLCRQGDSAISKVVVLP